MLLSEWTGEAWGAEIDGMKSTQSEGRAGLRVSDWQGLWSRAEAATAGHWAEGKDEPEMAPGHRLKAECVQVNKN